MRLRPDAMVTLDRRGPARDREVFDAILAARFEPEACREAVARLGLPAGHLDLDAFAHGGPLATRRLIWDEWAEAPIELRLGSAESEATVPLEEEQLPLVAEALRALGHARTPIEARKSIIDIADGEVADRFAQLVSPAPSPRQFPAITRPGIYRREHASLVIRSRTTTVITDPQMGMQSFTSKNYPTLPAPVDADAVLITHLHDDHWAPASILMVGHRDTKVIVPPVPRPSILCPAAPVPFLAACGVDAVGLAWWDSITVGDIRIQALPFYGEQPTRSADLLPADLRNWGSCYRVETPDFSVLVLADSGVDPAGSMDHVARRSFEERGPVTAVASCALEFPEAVNPGLPNYALVLPFSYLAEAHQTSEPRSITGGPSGVAAVCRATDAGWFLPYAHGFNGIGPVADDASADQVAAELLARGARTRVWRWNPGDVFEGVREAAGAAG